MPPTISIDYTPAYEQGGGIGRYVRELVQALAQHDHQTPYRLFVSGAGKPLPTSPGPNFSWRQTKIPPIWFARLWHRAHLPLPVELFTGRPALFHATDFVLPPTLPGTRTLLTVHDLSFIRVPETASPSLKAYLDRVVPASVQRADHILADSQATKDDLVALYGTAPEKITVLLSGVDPYFRPSFDPTHFETLKTKYHLPERQYIFSCGTVQPRKNYGLLIESLAHLRAEGRDLAIVIAGGKGWLEGPMYKTLRETGMSDFVHLIGFADDDDLPALYSHAACFALPSLYEGFGLPVLEAMACGTPVVTSNISSLPEVAGDATLLIEPTDLDALTNALRLLLDDAALRSTLIEAGKARAQQFTWEKAAQQLGEIYRQIIADN